MASRRKLKKILKFVSSELITDLYIKLLVNGKIEEKEVSDLVTEIVLLNRDFELRANKPDGKDNPQLVKKYYKQLYADWQESTTVIVGKIDKL